MTEPDLPALARQLERASLYTHSALGRSGLRVRELESFVFGLIDSLLAAGVITEAALKAQVEAVRSELDAAEVPEPGVVLRVDPPLTEPPPEVDCAARMHICHAVCCRLDFALSAEEVERGVLRWDLGRPYVIRDDPDGMCTHNDRSTGCCSVYDDRPQTCRRYSCATDARIWTDFERMELNSEWIAEHLGPSEPRLLHAMLAVRG